MSILIGVEIAKALKNGSIRIEPLDKSQVGPGPSTSRSATNSEYSRKNPRSTTSRNDPGSRTSPQASMWRTGVLW